MICQVQVQTRLDGERFEQEFLIVSFLRAMAHDHELCRAELFPFVFILLRSVRQAHHLNHLSNSVVSPPLVTHIEVPSVHDSNYESLGATELPL